MKKFLLTSAAACAMTALAVPAMAADLPIEPAPIEPAFVPPPAPMFTWTGFYVGANAGYAWGDFDVNNVALTRGPGDAFFVGVPLGTYDSGSFGFDGDGFIAGGQVGYNFQVDQFVFGVEADLQYTDIDGGALLFDFPAPGRAASVSTELDYLGTVRARAGFAMDRFMVYATGGLAYGRVDATSGIDNGLGDFSSASDRNTHVGYTVGAGVEGAVTDNITARLEYLYVDLGEETYNFSYPGTSTSAASDIEYDAHVVRAGLNYKFSF